MSKTEWFDGETHYLVPDEDFQCPAIWVVEDLVPFDEEEELEPYEMPTREPVLAEKPRTPNNPMPFADQQQAWGALAVALGSLSNMLQGKQKAYQENTYDGKTKELLEPDYSFKFEPGEFGYQEGRI